MSEGIVYVLSGRRDLSLLAQSIHVLRCHHASIPVIVHHDCDLTLAALRSPANVELIRFERRDFPETLPTAQTNRQRLAALMTSPFDTTIYLDNDVFVVDPAFFDGFGIGQFYGLSLPQNPRRFFFTRVGKMGDMEVGQGVSDFDRQATVDMPRHMMAYNTGLIIYNHRSRAFLQAWLEQFDRHPSRGQAALCRAIWETKQAPLALPVNWLVCRRDEGIELPITLHVGHKNIMAWWSRDFGPLINQSTRRGKTVDPTVRRPRHVNARAWHKTVKVALRALRRCLPAAERPTLCYPPQAGGADEHQ